MSLPSQPSTVEELKTAMAHLGLSPDEISRADDPDARTDEGAILFRSLPGGRCQVVTMGRGEELFPREFPSEHEAVRALAEEVLHPRPEGPRETPEQQAEVDARMQARAQEVLREIAEAQKRGGPS